MSTKLFYFTGTGNTLHIARQIASQLGDSVVEPVTRANPQIDPSVEAVGIIFPVYGWGMPAIVSDFVNKLENLAGKYVFAVCTYGGTLFSALKTTQRALQKKGAVLDAGFGIRMPVNYVQIFTCLPPQKQARMFQNADTKIARIVNTVKSRQKAKIEEWNVPILSALLLGMNGKMIKRLYDQDKAFHVDERCNGCGICAQVCPVSNIELKDKRPSWRHTCQQCLACLHWCPQAAIQIGKTPASRGRYHHPDVSLQDMKAKQTG
jgi:ferredoxin/flavodoxin